MATDLTALGEAVRPSAVTALMTARRPQLLDPNSDDHDLYVETVRGVCTEVQPYVGSQVSGPRWDLAVWAVTLGVAAQVEASLWPEQNGLGDSGNAAEDLQRRYESVLKQLGQNLPGDADGDGASARPPSPRGSFPEPPRYPDPAPSLRPRTGPWWR